MKTFLFSETLSRFFNGSKPIVFIDKGEDGRESISAVPYKETVKTLTKIFQEFLLHGQFLGREPIEDFFPVLKIWVRRQDGIVEYRYSSTAFGNWKVEKTCYNTMTEITGRSIDEKIGVIMEVKFPEVYHLILLQE